MANLYGLTKTDPVNAPIGVVGTPGVAVILPEGFSVPALKHGSIGGNLSIGGTLSVTGISTINNSLNVTGSNTITTSNLVINTNATLGSSATITFNGKINSSVLPNTTATYNLGSTSFRWANGYFSDINSSTLTATSSITGATINATVGLNVNGATALTGDLSSTGSILPKNLKFNDTTYTYNSQNTALNFFVQNTFTGTLTGCSTNPTATITYVRVGNLVILSASATLEATSNATTMTITGLPAWLIPATDKNMPHIVKDNGTLTIGKLVITSAGVLTFYKDVTNAVFTSSGTKGITGLTCCYTIV